MHAGERCGKEGIKLFCMRQLNVFMSISLSSLHQLHFSSRDHTIDCISERYRQNQDWNPTLHDYLLLPPPSPAHTFTHFCMFLMSSTAILLRTSSELCAISSSRCRSSWFFWRPNKVCDSTNLIWTVTTVVSGQGHADLQKGTHKRHEIQLMISV